MSWAIDDIPDLKGKVAVVTGGNGGLGFETAKALAGAGAHVVVAARNREKAQDALEDILSAHPTSGLEIVELDLGSLASVRNAASEIIGRHEAINILVNNAGLMAMPEGRTQDGFETQFGVNHLGHWVLTADLLPALLRADSARVVSVTSVAHHFGRSVDPDNPNLDGIYEPWKGYNQSKLANFHFALGLHAEFERRGLSAKSLVAHPGLSDTNLQTHTVEQGGGGSVGVASMGLARRFGMSQAQGALPQIRAATDPQARSGQMYAPRFINSGAAVRRPIFRRIGLRPAIDTLWSVSERMTGVALDFDRSPQS